MSALKLKADADVLHDLEQSGYVHGVHSPSHLEGFRFRWGEEEYFVSADGVINSVEVMKQEWQGFEEVRQLTDQEFTELFSSR